MKLTQAIRNPWLYFTLIVLLIIGLLFFWMHVRNQNLVRAIQTSDSIVQQSELLSKLPKGKYEHLMSRSIQRALTNHEHLLADSMLQHFKERGLEEENPVALSSVALTEAYRFIFIQQLDEGLKLLESTYNSYQVLKDFDILNYYHIRSLYHLHREERDSLKKYLDLGFNLSLQKEDPYEVSRFANNLAAYYYFENMVETSSKLLLLAINEVRKVDEPDPILLNNYLAHLTKKSKYEEAKEFFLEHREALEGSKQPYVRDMVLLQKAVIYGALGEWETQMSFVPLIRTIKRDWRSVALLILLDLEFAEYKGREALVTAVEQNLPDYVKFFPHSFSNNNYEYVSKVVSELEWPDLDELEKSVNEFQPSEVLDYNRVSLAYRFLSEWKRSQNQTQMALSYLDSSIVYLRQYGSKLEDVTTADIENIAEIQQMRVDLEDASKEIIFRTAGGAFLVILLFLITLLILRNNRKLKLLNQQREELLVLQQKELDYKEKELQWSIAEKKANERIVLFSKITHEKAKDIQDKLRELSQKSNPENRQVIHDLNSLIKGMLAFKEDSNPTMVDEMLREQSHDLDLWSFIHELNRTERRVLAMVLQDFRPKEISQTINISEQHTRNLKSKIKRIINAHGYADFEDLKQLPNQELLLDDDEG